LWNIYVSSRAETTEMLAVGDTMEAMRKAGMITYREPEL